MTNTDNQTDPSDQDNFSELIGFNERKDKDNLEINELETFINRQYKKGQVKDYDDSSSDEETVFVK